jgi:hypothetical protein
MSGGGGSGLTATIVDATSITPEVQAALDAIPFDQMKQAVKDGIAAGKQVDINLTPGKVEIKIKQGGGWSSMSGTWG